MPFSSPISRSPNLWKGHLIIPKRAQRLARLACFKCLLLELKKKQTKTLSVGWYISEEVLKHHGVFSKIISHLDPPTGAKWMVGGAILQPLRV